MPQRPQIELSKAENNYLCRTDSQRWPLGEKATEHPAVLLLFRKFNGSEMAERICGIYKIESKVHPDRIYIGSAIDIYKRWNNHRWKLNKNRHENSKLQRHCNKYGLNDLSFSLIELCSIKLLLKKEQDYLILFNPWFNICKIAGNTQGLAQSRETKNKISRAKRGIELPPFTEEHKRKIGEQQIGEKNHRFGKPSPMKGKHHSKESNKKNSESQKKTWARKKAEGYIPPPKEHKYSSEEIKERKKVQKRRYRLRDKIMAKLHINELTAGNLLKAEIPMNHVLIETEVTWHDKKSKGGIVVGFNEDVLYATDEGSHTADLTIPYGIVRKIPKMLYYNPTDPKSMDWETEIEIAENDVVWFGILESRNAICVLCENRLYRIIPYQDLYVARKGGFHGDVVCLNGVVLLKPCFCPVLGDLDHLSAETIDMTRGVIKFIGEPPKGYIRDNYSHIDDLRVGDEVLFDKKCPLFYLERSRSLATFDGDNQYWVTQRRRIAMILNR